MLRMLKAASLPSGHCVASSAWRDREGTSLDLRLLFGEATFNTRNG